MPFIVKFVNTVCVLFQIRATIEDVKNEYQNDKSINASLLWQMVKLKVREQTLRYAKTKKAKMLREKSRGSTRCENGVLASV